MAVPINEKTHFHHYHLGEVILSQPFRFSAEEIIAFSSQYDQQFFHTDPKEAARSYFGGLVASGWQTAAMSLNALFQRQHGLEEGMVGIGVDNLRWLAPVYPGDTLIARAVVTEARPSNSRAGWGIVRVEIETTNQHHTPVMRMSTSTLMKIET